MSLKKSTNGTFGIDLDAMDDESSYASEYEEDIEEEDFPTTQTSRVGLLETMEDEEEEEIPTGNVHVDDFLPKQLDLDATKLHIMKATLFDDVTEPKGITPFKKRRTTYTPLPHEEDEEEWRENVNGMSIMIICTIN
jgi:hypothetical protein